MPKQSLIFHSFHLTFEIGETSLLAEFGELLPISRMAVLSLAANGGLSLYFINIFLTNLLILKRKNCKLYIRFLENC